MYSISATMKYVIQNKHNQLKSYRLTINQHLQGHNNYIFAGTQTQQQILRDMYFIIQYIFRMLVGNEWKLLVSPKWVIPTSNKSRNH